MKKIFTAFAIITIVASCNRPEKKPELKSNSTILVAPATNSNLTDTHGVFTDSSKVDSNHNKPATPESK